MKLVSLKCPDCKANLNIEISKNRKHCFCEYCGSKIYIDDGATSHTYRKIDEARIKEAEVRENIKLKEIQLKEKEIKILEKQMKNQERRIRAEHRLKRLKVFLFALFVVLSIGCIIIGFTTFIPGFMWAGVIGAAIIVNRLTGND